MKDFGPIMQHGYIVEDVAKVAKFWTDELGVGPFYVLDRVDMDQYFYCGKRTPIALRIAFGYWGSVQIELIQQLNDADTLYARALKESPNTLNHCACIVTGLDALLKRWGLEAKVIQSGKMPGGVEFAYLDSYLPGGQHLELIQGTEQMLGGLAAMEAIAKSWDGKNPVRPVSAVAEDAAALRKTM